jgi:hypothetical protein
MRTNGRRTGAIIGAGLGAAALGWLGYAAVAWRRYGRPRNERRRDTLLDRYMPDYEVTEHHVQYVHAPATITYTVARELDLLHSPAVRLLLRAREVILRGEHTEEQLPFGLIDQMQAIGWTILAEEPDRQIVLGAVTQPWDAHPQFRGMRPDEFLAFSEPGYVKIVWTLAVVSLAPMHSIIRSATRATTTDAMARKRFRRYWAAFSPGIFLIRSEGLRLVRAEAERRYRAETTAAPANV